MPVSPARKLELIQRRQQIADLYLKGWGQTAIADQLGVRQSTISADLKKIQVAWRQSAIRDFDALRDFELAKILRVEREAWSGYERSQQPSQSATMDGQAGSQKARRTVRHQYGDPKFLDIVLQCGQARRELLGLDAPVKVAPTTPEGQPLTREQRQLHIEAILTEKFGRVDALPSPCNSSEAKAHENSSPEVSSEDGSTDPARDRSHPGTVDGCRTPAT